jgi:hypothetical protein
MQRAAHRGRHRRVIAIAVTLLLVAASVGACDASDAYMVKGCQRADLEGESVARVWDEQVLSLIRQVVPAPTVHARNLFHTSAALWDAWAAYDPDADGYLVNEKHSASDKNTAREAAMSFAAYRILAWRYGTVSDLKTAQDELDATMASLCYRTDYASTDGDSPAAVGNRIAAAVLAYGETDGAHEEERYTDASYKPLNEPLDVTKSGTVMADPNHWQPLALAQQISQNGIPIPGQVQSFIGPYWGHVTSFALPASDAGTPIDPGPPPLLGTSSDDSFKQAAVDIIRFSSELDPADGATIDVSPGSQGDNSLGTNDGNGYEVNPATGVPYVPHVVPRADFMRALAEFWADGPKSETPPGHWNLVANAASDAMDQANLRIGGKGAPVDRLEWDTKLYLALNAAVHDAAIAAWGLKGHYDSARPISMIRYMGERGQSSDPGGPAHDPEGLPLVPGMIEVVTAESSAAGQRHEALKGHVGEIAIKSWRGFPKDPETETSGVGWILAGDWVPYQRSTFVTPAFAGYVSGHSTFSRAAAEVMTAFAGDPYFPGGISEWTTKKGTLKHEEGPTEDVTLQWATYYDAADQAGISRLFMGIHIASDDVEGRKLGAICGTDAMAKALTYFDGTAIP